MEWKYGKFNTRDLKRSYSFDLYIIFSVCTFSTFHNLTKVENLQIRKYSVSRIRLIRRYYFRFHLQTRKTSCFFLHFPYRLSGLEYFFVFISRVRRVTEIFVRSSIKRIHNTYINVGRQLFFNNFLFRYLFNIFLNTVYESMNRIVNSKIVIRFSVRFSDGLKNTFYLNRTLSRIVNNFDLKNGSSYFRKKVKYVFYFFIYKHNICSLK